LWKKLYGEVVVSMVLAELLVRLVVCFSVWSSQQLVRRAVWVVYGRTGGANALHFWNYINDIGFGLCDNPFGQNCTYSIMDRIGIETHFIERCIDHAHGLDNDMANIYLDEQVGWAIDLNASMVPALKIGQHWYNGTHSTDAIFQAICAAYPAEHQPVVCDFCRDCSDVRYCLWFLQCDGITFDVYSAARANNGYAPESSSTSGQYTQQLPPSDNTNGGTTTSPSSADNGNADSAAATANSAQIPDGNSGEAASSPHENESGKKAKDALLQGILVGIAIGLVTTCYFACRAWQAQIVLNAIVREDDVDMPGKKRSLVESMRSCRSKQPQLEGDYTMQTSFVGHDDDEPWPDPDDFLYEFSERSSKIIT
jgi:hypothetical protein